LNTRRKACSLLALTIALFIISADSEAGSHYLGLEGGLNSSKLSQPENSSIESIYDYSLGIIGVIAITPWLSFQPEAMYTVKGAKGSAVLGASTAASVDGTAKLKYLEIPLLIRFMYPNKSDFVPHLFAGPALAANLSAKADATLYGQPFSGDIEEIVNDRDFGLVIGGGVDFNLSTTKISLDVRYTHGFMSVDDSQHLSDVKNQVWTISTAVLFRVGGSGDGS
jgi:hypothetical protein